MIRDVLTRSHADCTIQVFDQDDHGMHGATGALDPGYLDTMRAWLVARVRTSR